MFAECPASARPPSPVPSTSRCGPRSPLGEIAVDRDALEAALALPQVRHDDAAHALEHLLEVQLPFLRAILGEFVIIPLAVGDASPEEVAEVIELLWGGPETLIVVSSDLPHCHRYADAQAIDRATADSILRLSPTLGHEQACATSTPATCTTRPVERRPARAAAPQ
ncbi:MAG: AmmeMemoRadiSam system protein B [Casimicrobiaceae bacterium]